MSTHSRNTSTTTTASSAPGSIREITAGPNLTSAFSDWDGSETSSQRGRPESMNSNPNTRLPHLQDYSPPRSPPPPVYSATSDMPFASHSRAPSYNTTQQEEATAGARDLSRQSFVGIPGRPIEGLQSKNGGMITGRSSSASQEAVQNLSDTRAPAELYSTFTDSTRLDHAHYESRRRDPTQQRITHQPRRGGSTPLNPPTRESRSQL
ncbi:hypothetical protein I302_100328 [Kwoniella bestiolae CBS 10118]|uniref:Uncharacterized protein n=1 Tax=Kwoniella bestiolae CBS 10118 TaxID=1296100 RepID=A0A1B9G4U1_9TREE|nr:hypothetical protein I302_03700 [Kwoniella bestiolae CBS 10118]OCF26023.1 hypothetical protein I302_03700 [Kwoniella bestiolae CBS 10118]